MPLRRARITDNVVDLMTRKIRRLLADGAARVDAGRVRSATTSTGARLLTVSRQSPEEAAAGLAEALRCRAAFSEADDAVRGR